MKYRKIIVKVLCTLCGACGGKIAPSEAAPTDAADTDAADEITDDARTADANITERCLTDGGTWSCSMPNVDCSHCQDSTPSCSVKIIGTIMTVYGICTP